MCRPSPAPLRTSAVAASLFLIAASACVAADGLGESPSAFLRERVEAPVKWMPWGDAAFARAKTEAKPVFLVVGSTTSELGSAMHRQSFSGAEVSAFLNENFVCVLVDRDERPDVAALYQTYVREAKQLNGWPLNIWLTPELKPIDGATYLPPTEEWGKEGFYTAAKRIGGAWKSGAAVQRRNAGDAVDTVRAAFELSPPPQITGEATDALLASAAKAWLETFDKEHGGFGDAPRYPEPELLRFLMRTDAAGREAALVTLRAMAAGAIRDPLDGGFFRYATDTAWHVPYLQKSLVDQARLALAYLDAAKVSGDESLATVARGALDYALARLARPGGGFATAEDFTAAETALTIAWTGEEIRTLLKDTAAEFIRLHGVVADGNLSANDDPDGRWKGKNILAGPSVVTDAIKAARATLLVARQKRQPAAVIHENVATGANGLFLTALSRAGAQTKDARYLDAARRLAGFIREKLIDATTGDVRTLPGSSALAGPMEYAQIVAGLLELHAATNTAEWRDLARVLAKRADALYLDSKSGRSLCTSEPLTAGLWARVPVPSPSAGEPPSAGATRLITLSTLAKDDDPQGASAGLLARAIAAEIQEGPAAARGDLLLALQFTRAK